MGSRLAHGGTAVRMCNTNRSIESSNFQESVICVTITARHGTWGVGRVPGGAARARQPTHVSLCHTPKCQDPSAEAHRTVRCLGSMIAQEQPRTIALALNPRHLIVIARLSRCRPCATAHTARNESSSVQVQSLSPPSLIYTHCRPSAAQPESTHSYAHSDQSS